jgi:UDP-N-acetylmuramate--alanine ligase
MKHIHFIGIGGTGLSAIAMVLLERGFMVSGSDQHPSNRLQRLQEKGAKVIIGHDEKNIIGADLIVRSSAVPDDNPEIQAALREGMPVLKRVNYLSQLIADQRSIAIAGTHGKTTTTAMLAWALSSLGFDPSYVIGGDSKNLGKNAHAGNGDYFVIEADEYDRMFHGLNPFLAVVTNIEHDHPDCYGTKEELLEAFWIFVDQILPNGILLVCGEDQGVQDLLGAVAREDIRIFTYGKNPEFDFYVSDIEINQYSGFTFQFHDSLSALEKTVDLMIPGEQNVLNACAVLAVTALLEISLQDAAKALKNYKGTERRFEIVGVVNGITFIDDYAHHPTEIKATLAAARSIYKDHRIWVVWQPHTYSRIQILFDQFLEVFSDANFLLITDIYAARESAPEDGFSSKDLVESIKAQVDVRYPDTRYIPDVSDLSKDFQSLTMLLEKELKPNDVLVVLSAGDANQIIPDLMSRFDRKLASYDELVDKFGKSVQKNFPLAVYTSARMGGNADYFYQAESVESLIEIVSFVWKHRIPFVMIGAASNVLVSEKGVRGLVIQNRANHIHLDEEAATVWAESGTNLGVLARKVSERGFSGFEWAAGIPGTVGGAVVGNAGAHGSDMASMLIVADILHLNNKGSDFIIDRRNFSREELEFSYRSSILKKPDSYSIVLAAQFQLVASEKELIQERMRTFRQYRQETQPPGASMGSMFKNPPNGFAGQLIEQSGLKGARIGDVQISPVHANFMINLGEAKPSDVYTLIQKVQKTVFEESGVQLELEIELLGDW